MIKILATLQGTLVNGTAIALGALFGVLIGRLVPERCHQIAMQGIGLVVILIGLSMALQSDQLLLLILSLILGGIAGELARLEERLLAAGRWLENRTGSGRASLAGAFVNATLIYAVGAMAVTGALESGLSGRHQILYAKSILDGISAVIFASSMGVGVAFAAVPVMLYEGSIALLARVAASILTIPVINELSATGGILILAIGLNLLQIKEIRVGNLLPAFLFNLLFMLACGLT